jgi:hypothetical protein
MIAFCSFHSTAALGGTQKRMEAMPARYIATGSGEMGVVRRKLRAEEAWAAEARVIERVFPQRLSAKRNPIVR